MLDFKIIFLTQLHSFSGNMALKFENNGTCLIVKQYLDRSREMLRLELLQKVSDLLVEAKSSSESQGAGDEKKTDDVVVASAKSF